MNLSTLHGKNAYEVDTKLFSPKMVVLSHVFWSDVSHICWLWLLTLLGKNGMGEFNNKKIGGKPLIVKSLFAISPSEKYCPLCIGLWTLLCCKCWIRDSEIKLKYK